MIFDYKMPFYLELCGILWNLNWLGVPSKRICICFCWTSIITTNQRPLSRKFCIWGFSNHNANINLNYNPAGGLAYKYEFSGHIFYLSIHPQNPNRHLTLLSPSSWGVCFSFMKGRTLCFPSFIHEFSIEFLTFIGSNEVIKRSSKVSRGLLEIFIAHPWWLWLTS